MSDYSLERINLTNKDSSFSLKDVEKDIEEYDKLKYALTHMSDVAYYKEYIEKKRLKEYEKEIPLVYEEFEDDVQNPFNLKEH